MPSSSDVFILSTAHSSQPAEALEQALHASGADPARVQDLLVGADDSLLPDVPALAHQAKLVCPTVVVSSSLRALIFAAQSILCEDVDLALVVGIQNGQATALLLGSPSVIGIYNLMPLARLDAHSFAGSDAVLRQVQLAAEDVQIRLDGNYGALLVTELVIALEQKRAGWGMVTSGQTCLLIERI